MVYPILRKVSGHRIAQFVYNLKNIDRAMNQLTRIDTVAIILAFDSTAFKWKLSCQQLNADVSIKTL